VMCADLVVLMFVVETRTYGFGAWFFWYLIWTGRNCVVEIGMEDAGFPPLIRLPFADVQIFTSSHSSVASKYPTDPLILVSTCCLVGIIMI
jgi:hypothetical protein